MYKFITLHCKLFGLLQTLTVFWEPFYWYAAQYELRNLTFISLIGQHTSGYTLKVIVSLKIRDIMESLALTVIICVSIIVQKLLEAGFLFFTHEQIIHEIWSSLDFYHFLRSVARWQPGEYTMFLTINHPLGSDMFQV